MKYFYKKEYWGDYCKRNNIDYKCAYKMYIYYKNKYKDTYSNDKLMEYVVEKQKLLKSKKRLIKYFRLLNDESNLIDYKEICEVLKINYIRVQILSRSRYSKNFVIKSIWIFSDLETDGLKTISLKKWREVKKLYENPKYQFEEMIMSYRLGNHAILPNILEYETPILSKLVYKFAYKNYLKLDNEKYQDLLSEMYTIFLNTLNKIVYNYSGQIVNYLYLSLQFRIQDYIKINYKKNLEFDESYIHASKKIYEVF